MPKLSLPVRLVLLIAGTTLPLIIFAAVIVFSNYEQDRKDASQRVVETVRSIRLVLDAEMQRMTGGLQVLSLTNALRDGDFEGFRRIAAGFLDQYGKDGVVLVADREGRQLFSSVTPDAANLPPRNNREIVDRVFTTNRPQYSNLFIGAVYDRGAMTLQALRLTVGDRAFFRILRSWAQIHRGGNVTTEQFIALAERTSGKDLGALFTAWLYTPSKPAHP